MKTVKWKTYCAALNAAQKQFAEYGISVYNLNDSTVDAPIRLGVRWPSIGTVTPDEAAKFADRLLDAAMLAQEFRYAGYTIDYSDC